MLLCREAVDAGQASLAVDAVRAWPSDAPLGRAVRATIEAAATQDEDRWHEALSIAIEHGLRLVAVDASRRARRCGGCLRVLGRVPPARGRSGPVAG